MATALNEIKPLIAKRKRKKRSLVLNNASLLLFALPGIIYVILYNYLPMYGILITFKDFSPYDGIIGSPWVGFSHFKRFFNSYQFVRLLKNTIGLSFYQLLAGFPFPVILALSLNQVNRQRFKKTVQTVTYAPHFISVVVLCGMLNTFLSPGNGIVNILIRATGGKSIFFLAEPSMFKSIYVISGIWQNAGWGAIIYLSALSSINPELYEAAKMDGASKLQSAAYIDIPMIMPTIVIVFILSVGRIMDVGFQKVYLLQTDLNLASSEVIATYVYKVGLKGAEFSFAAAVGLFNVVINMVLILSINQIARRSSETSLF